VKCLFNFPVVCHGNDVDRDEPTVSQLRWDQANIELYYNLTGTYLQDLLHDLNVYLSADSGSSLCDSAAVINDIYDRLVDALNYCANQSVPVRRKNFYKFWWSQELDHLKDEAIKSHRIWQAAGRPRSGACFTKYRSDKIAYKKAIHQHRLQENLTYTNDLQETLLKKEEFSGIVGVQNSAQISSALMLLTGRLTTKILLINLHNISARTVLHSLQRETVNCFKSTLKKEQSIWACP